MTQVDKKTPDVESASDKIARNQPLGNFIIALVVAAFTFGVWLTTVQVKVARFGQETAKIERLLETVDILSQNIEIAEHNAKIEAQAADRQQLLDLCRALNGTIQNPEVSGRVEFECKLESGTVLSLRPEVRKGYLKLPKKSGAN